MRQLVLGGCEGLLRHGGLRRSRGGHRFRGAVVGKGWRYLGLDIVLAAVAAVVRDRLTLMSTDRQADVAQNASSVTPGSAWIRSVLVVAESTDAEPLSTGAIRNGVLGKAREG